MGRWKYFETEEGRRKFAKGGGTNYEAGVIIRLAQPTA